MAVWRSWSARLPVTQEVAGSSPATVANGPLVKQAKTPAPQAGDVSSNLTGVTKTNADSIIKWLFLVEATTRGQSLSQIDCSCVAFCHLLSLTESIRIQLFSELLQGAFFCVS